MTRRRPFQAIARARRGGTLRRVTARHRLALLAAASGWLALAVLAVAATASPRRMLAIRYDGAACGYDLRTTPAQCPECGRAAHAA